MQTSKQIIRRYNSRASGPFWLIALLLFLGLALFLATRTGQEGVRAQMDKASAIVHGFVLRGTVALTNYKHDMGEYPSMGEGLSALLRPPVGKAATWKGPYLETLPLDPWKQPYVYRLPGTHNKDGYDLFSKGADQTADTLDDIGNW